MRDLKTNDCRGLSNYKDRLPDDYYIKDKAIYCDEYINEDITLQSFICSPLEIVEFVCDSNSNNWGRVLKFTDPEGKIHLVEISMMMLAGNGESVCEDLLREGLLIGCSTFAREKLFEYIMFAKPEKKETFIYD